MLITFTSLVAVVTPTDRPKSVNNRCVIEFFGVVFCVVTLLFGFCCGCSGFCHRAESDLFLFLLNYLSKNRTREKTMHEKIHFHLFRFILEIH